MKANGRFFHTVVMCWVLCAGTGLAQNAQGTISAEEKAQQQQSAQTNSATQSDDAVKPGTSSQSPTQSSKPEPGTTTAPQTGQAKESGKKEQSERMLGVLPRFGVTDRQDAPPLTPGGKFHLFTKSAFDPVSFGVVGLQAGISQAQNDSRGYGQGAAGYGKRYGAAFADQVSSGFFSNFFYPVLLKEDPRYFRLGQGTFKHRLGYALKQELVAHTDRGGRTFNFSNVLGAFSSGGLSNVYYPQSDRGFGLTMSRSGYAIAYGSLGCVANEFYPDIARKLFHKRKKGQTP